MQKPIQGSHQLMISTDTYHYIIEIKYKIIMKYRIYKRIDLRKKREKTKTISDKHYTSIPLTSNEAFHVRRINFAF